MGKRGHNGNRRPSSQSRPDRSRPSPGQQPTSSPNSSTPANPPARPTAVSFTASRQADLSKLHQLLHSSGVTILGRHQVIAGTTVLLLEDSRLARVRTKLAKNGTFGNSQPAPTPPKRPGRGPDKK